MCRDFTADQNLSATVFAIFVLNPQDLAVPNELRSGKEGVEKAVPCVEATRIPEEAANVVLLRPIHKLVYRGQGIVAIRNL